MSKDVFWDWVDRLKDPELVAGFQRYFGVQEVKRNSVGNPQSTQPFISQNYDDLKRRSKKATNAGTGNGNGTSSARSTGSSSSSSSAEDTDNPSASGWSINTTGASDLLQQKHLSEDELKDRNVIFYRIGSKFWHYLFLFGTQLGDEAWYIFLFGLWFWNIDGAVGRRVYFIFAFVMYIGQAAKDVIRWPRPQMPPCIQIETKWSMEYGMPSTHSISLVSFSVCFTYFRTARAI